MTSTPPARDLPAPDIHADGPTDDGTGDGTGDEGTDRTRLLLAGLVDALREHLEAAEARSGEADPAVYAAFDHLREAFEAYEESLYDVHDEVTPFVVLDIDDEDDEDL